MSAARTLVAVCWSGIAGLTFPVLVAAAEIPSDSTTHSAAADQILAQADTAAPANPPADAAAKKDPEAGAANSDAVTLETVEVTAQRRVERLQDVPVAVTAVSRDQLDVRRVEDIGSLDGIAPGLQISKTPSNTTISQITIRGASQINPAIYWDPAVGIYLDGVYIGKAQGSVFDIVDLMRVEVLRGPQGTLYGRNTIGGTVNLWSRDPSGAFSGQGSLEFGNYNAMMQKIYVDLPKLGIASISVGARSERRDGWITTTRDSSVNELNNRHNDGVRLATRLEFSPSLIGDYRFDHSNVNQTNNFDQLYRIEGDLAFALGSFASTERASTAGVNSPSFERSEVTGHSFTLTWNLDSGNVFKSITGYRQLEWDDSLDLDGSPLPFVFTQRFTDYTQLSQDLQFIGGTDRWNYVAGLYYFGDDGRTDNPQAFFQIDPNNDIYFDSRYGTETSAWAAYGQVDWRVMDLLTLAAGVRYTREEKDLDRVFGFKTAPEDPFTYIMPEGLVHPSETFDATTPMVSVKYQPSRNLNVYARYAEGFKSGGFNGEFSDLTLLPDDNITETQTPFHPEKQKSIEIGAKTTFAGGHGQINVAAFHNKLKDLQASIFSATGAASSIIRNVGKATVQGVEVEAAFLPVPGTQLRANYAFLDAEYDEFLVEDAQGNDVNEADNRAFVHAPKNAFNLVADSKFLKGQWGALRGTVDYVWTDSFFTYPYHFFEPPPPDPNNPPPPQQLAGDTEVDVHGILNLRLAIVDVPLDDMGWGELSIWCRNVLNDDTASNFIDFGPGFGSLTVANFEEPRTFGITGTVRW
jgi:iron complex outermembrane receptor protein